MRLWIAALLVVGPAAAFAACGLDVTGDPGRVAERDGGGSSRHEEDAGAIAIGIYEAPDGAVTTNDAGDPVIVTPPVDGGAGLDCPDAGTTGGTGFTIAHARKPVVVDGQLDEWACARFVKFDTRTAQRVIGDVTIPNTYTFAVSWEAESLFVAGVIVDPSPNEGTEEGVHVYKNDALEVYFGGDETFNGTYTAKDHQYVFDWKNRRWSYQHSTNAPVGPGVVSAVKPTADGFIVEARIPVGELGLPRFSSGAKIGFAIVGIDSAGTKQQTWALWRRPSVPCDAGCCLPYCNTRYFEEVRLAP